MSLLENFPNKKFNGKIFVSGVVVEVADNYCHHLLVRLGSLGVTQVSLGVTMI